MSWKSCQGSPNSRWRLLPDLSLLAPDCPTLLWALSLPCTCPTSEPQWSEAHPCPGLARAGIGLVALNCASGIPVAGDSRWGAASELQPCWRLCITGFVSFCLFPCLQLQFSTRVRAVRELQTPETQNPLWARFCVPEPSSCWLRSCLKQMPLPFFEL